MRHVHALGSLRLRRRFGLLVSVGVMSTALALVPTLPPVAAPAATTSTSSPNGA
jgi:hypothetical protein